MGISKAYKISISKPCSKEWDEMLPVINGRYCNSCEKNVIDFTALSDSEIIDFFRVNNGKETCGKFYKTQLETIRIEFPEDILFSKIPGWKRFLIVFLICFGYQLFTVEFVLAQSNPDDSCNTITVTDSMGTLATNSEDTLLTEVEKEDSTIEAINPTEIVGDYTVTCETIAFGNVCVTRPEEEDETIFNSPFAPVKRIKKEPVEKKPVKNETEHRSDMLLEDNSLGKRGRKRRA